MRGTVAMVAVRAAFGLKRPLKLHRHRSEAAEHRFDDVVRPDAKSPSPDFGRHIAVAEMPRESQELTQLRVSDIDDGFRRRSNDKPRPVIEPQAVSIGHRDRCVRSRRISSH
jgi:hypothetical protein